MPLPLKRRPRLPLRLQVLRPHPVTLPLLPVQGQAAYVEFDQHSHHEIQTQSQKKVESPEPVGSDPPRLAVDRSIRQPPAPMRGMCDRSLPRPLSQKNPPKALSS